MSLINDALRRASQNPKREPKEHPSMQPNYRPIRTGGPGFSILVICFLLAAAVTAGAWLYWKRGGFAALKTAPAPVANTNNNPIARAAKTLGTVQALNQEGEKTADALQPAAKPAEPVAPATPTAAASTSAGAPRLQAIFFSKNPTALISGKSVKVGDEVEGAKVLLITQKSVRVQIGAETRELTIK